MLNAMRFDTKCNAFWCKMQCVLILNAMRFGAKHITTTNVLTEFLCCFEPKFGAIFLQREMQKHSK